MLIIIVIIIIDFASFGSDWFYAINYANYG